MQSKHIPREDQIPVGLHLAKEEAHPVFFWISPFIIIILHPGSVEICSIFCVIQPHGPLSMNPTDP